MNPFLLFILAVKVSASTGALSTTGASIFGSVNPHREQNFKFVLFSVPQFVQVTLSI
jgi:hypothetical protein